MPGASGAPQFPVSASQPVRIGFARLVLAPAEQYCAALALTVLPLVAQTVVGQTVVALPNETVQTGLWVAAQPVVLRVSLSCGSRQTVLASPSRTAD